MAIMTRLEIKRLLQQKLIYFFLGLFIFAVIAYSGLLTSAALRELVDADDRILGGHYFPEFMLRFYSTNVGALFLAMITALFICEDRQAGLLVQPLLHGRTKKEVLTAKINMLCLFSLVMMIIIGLIVYTISYFRWGDQIFSAPIFSQSLIKYTLVAFSFIPLELFLILLAVFARHTVIVLGETFLLLMFFVFLNHSFPKAACFFPLYYPYEWIIQQEFQALTWAEIYPGLLIFLIYSLLIYFSIIHCSNKINFDR